MSPVIPAQDRLCVCPVCGQIFDTNHLGQVFHHMHEDGREDPFPPDAH